MTNLLLGDTFHCFKVWTDGSMKYLMCNSTKRVAVYSVGHVGQDAFKPTETLWNMSLSAGWLTDKTKAGADLTEAKCTSRLSESNKMRLHVWLHRVITVEFMFTVCSSGERNWATDPEATDMFGFNRDVLKSCVEVQHTVPSPWLITMLIKGTTLTRMKQTDGQPESILPPTHHYLWHRGLKQQLLRSGHHTVSVLDFSHILICSAMV